MPIGGIYSMERAVEIIQGARSRRTMQDVKDHILPHLQTLYQVTLEKERYEAEQKEWYNRANETARIQRKANMDMMQDNLNFTTDPNNINRIATAQATQDRLNLQNQNDLLGGAEGIRARQIQVEMANALRNGELDWLGDNLDRLRLGMQYRGDNISYNPEVAYAVANERNSVNRSGMTADQLGRAYNGYLRTWFEEGRGYSNSAFITTSAGYVEFPVYDAIEYQGTLYFTIPVHSEQEREFIEENGMLVGQMPPETIDGTTYLTIPYNRFANLTNILDFSDENDIHGKVKEGINSYTLSEIARVSGSFEEPGVININGVRYMGNITDQAEDMQIINAKRKELEGVVSTMEASGTLTRIGENETADAAKRRLQNQRIDSAIRANRTPEYRSRQEQQDERSRDDTSREFNPGALSLFGKSIFHNIRNSMTGQEQRYNEETGRMEWRDGATIDETELQEAKERYERLVSDGASKIMIDAAKGHYERIKRDHERISRHRAERDNRETELRLLYEKRSLDYRVNSLSTKKEVSEADREKIDRANLRREEINAELRILSLTEEQKANRIKALEEIPTRRKVTDSEEIEYQMLIGEYRSPLR